MKIVYENLEDYNLTKKKRVLIVFDDMILRRVVTEVFLRGRKLNILPAFISQSYFKVPKTLKTKATQYFIIKIHVRDL